MVNHAQNQLTIGAYFTKLKTVWEELSNYRPSCSCGKCTCKGIKALEDHYQTEYVMSFFMGLDDSFAQTRSQILLMDPIPPINKVFALVSQEKLQRTMNNVAGTSTGNNPMAFNIKNEGNRSNNKLQPGKYQKKDRSIYSYCGFTGHSINKCYKLHGYPPGYKPRQKGSYSNQGVNATAHLVSESSNDQGNIGGFVQTLPDQYHQLLTMLNIHLTSAKTSTELDVKLINTAGISFSVSNHPNLHSPRHWIVDSDATNHVCFDQSLFHTLVPISNSFFTLPNKTRIQVNFSGIIRINPSLILYDVLYVPQFQFNLLSVTSLTRNSSLQIIFLMDRCLIQKIPTLKTIGRGNKVADLYVIESAYCSNSCKSVPAVITCNSSNSNVNNVSS
ncbi:uncharacterized protein LOC111387248 [Olea europaea var. sylvestris]|uniref:uncharacterized protein LOC111387248 n=1 Tax=Olea europaea var. sylvestris TaxID=158386 RepID=UPI000C1CF5E4|nr:uncharacterized protein LOC111387248 [Olea europaea var. sylvestris]